MKERILQMIKESCAIDEPDLNANSNLKEISIDSLSFVGLIVNLEEEFKIEFDDEELNIYDYETVKQIIDIVEEKINGETQDI